MTGEISLRRHHRWLRAVAIALLLLSSISLVSPEVKAEEKTRVYLTLQTSRLTSDAAYPGEVERDFNNYACIPGREQIGDPASDRSAWLLADGTLEGKCQNDGVYQGGKDSVAAALTGRVDVRSGQVSFSGKSSQSWDYPKGHQAASPNAPAHYDKFFDFEGTGTYKPNAAAPNQPQFTQGIFKFTYRYVCTQCPAPYDKTVTGSFPFEMSFQVSPSPQPQQATCQAPPVITTQQIDLYLDFLAAQLQFADEKADLPLLDPLSAQSLNTGFSVKDAADLGRAAWDQAHGLQLAHVRHELTLNEPQKQRTKAFGHWASYLEKRAASPWRIGASPKYPLFGEIKEKVETPPQLKGEDIFVMKTPWGAEAITSDYFSAAMWTLAQGADMWYTRGLLWSAYLAYSQSSVWPVALTGAVYIPYFGPALLGTLVTFTEGNGLYRYFTEGENPLNWDEHLANYSSLINLGLGAYLRVKPNAARASATGGIDEGLISPEVAKKFDRKSFRVVKERTDSSGQKYQTVEYAVTGPLKENPQNKVSYFTDEFRVVNGPDGSRYFTAGPDGRLQDPVFFLGEKGYHAWSHLTEIKAGHPTPFDSMLSLFDGKRDYLRQLQGIEKAMRDPAKSLAASNRDYINFVNKLVDDKSFTRVTGFYRWKSMDGKLLPAEANQFIMLPTSCGSGGQQRTIPVRVSIDSTNGRLMNVFPMKPHNPAETFVPENKLSVVRTLFAMRSVDRRLIAFQPLSNQLPPDWSGQ